MSTASLPPQMSLEEFRVLPTLDDGIELLLFRGEVVEETLTQRSRHHAFVESGVSHVLRTWLDTRPQPFGSVFSGEVGCELPEQNSSFGIDVALFSNQCLSQQDPESPYIVGPPVLAVEILSPSDSQQGIQRKVDIYLAAGVSLVWVIDPHLKTVIVYSPDSIPELKAGDEVLGGGNVLPEFSVVVSKLFH